MDRPPGDGAWRVGYVGTAWPFGDGSALGDHEGVGIEPVSVEDVSAADADALVVDADLVAQVVDRLDAPAAVAILAVGNEDEIAVTPEALRHVDEYVVLDGDPAALVEPLLGQLTSRWRSLGMDAEEFLDTLFSQTPAHLYVKDREGRHVRSSEYYDSENDLVGRTDAEAYPEEGFGRRTFEDDIRVVQTGEPVVGKEEYNPGDGDWALTSKTPMRDPTGSIVGLVGFTQLITKRKEYEQALERQNERLEQFAEILSHDLRNPLSVANGRLKLAREADPDNEHLAAVAESLDRIDELVEDVLTLTRGGQRVVDAEPVSLASLCGACWDVVATGDATLSVADVTIRADPDRLRHVFENLFRNSVEHGGTDVSVTVGPLADGDGFYVADDGPGIPEDEREQIFEQGYTTSADGTGLGLEIVRQIADAHDWTVDVTESEQGGARFEIRAVECVE